MSTRQDVEPRAERRQAPQRGANGGRRDEDRITIRFRGEERDKVMLGAARAGLSLASYVRALALGVPVPRTRKLSPIDAEQMARGVAALNKVGSNLSQIAKTANAGGQISAPSLALALAEVRAALNEILVAAGRKGQP